MNKRVPGVREEMAGSVFSLFFSKPRMRDPDEIISRLVYFGLQTAVC
jgi:hypothetical protein